MIDDSEFRQGRLTSRDLERLDESGGSAKMSKGSDSRRSREGRWAGGGPLLPLEDVLGGLFSGRGGGGLRPLC